MRYNRAVFLDRDGVLTKPLGDRPPWNLQELEYYNHSRRLIATITSRGYIPIVVTNQPDAARGNAPLASIKSVEHAVKEYLGLAYYYACYHPYDNLCACRKPSPGLLYSASADLNIDLSSSLLIGDRAKDILAGVAANCTTILFNSSQSERSKLFLNQPDYICSEYNSLASLLGSLLSSS